METHCCRLSGQKIALCERRPDHWFVSKFHDNPICLRNGFRETPISEQVAPLPGRDFEFPESRAQLAALRRLYALPPTSVGMLYRLDPDGNVLDVVPLVRGNGR